MSDALDLLRRLKAGGTASCAELDEVAECLKQADSESDRYTLLHILGLSRQTRYRDSLEQYLSYPRDPMLSRIALLGLCAYWGEAARYRDVLRRFVLGVAWDVEADVQRAAISIAGAYLRVHRDPELLRDLHAIAGRTDDSLIRQGAQDALRRAGGEEWSDILSSGSSESPDH